MPLCLAAVIVLWGCFLFIRPHVNNRIITMGGALLLQNSLPEAQWNLTGSLPACPVLK